MEKIWTKRERLEAVLRGELPDRPPISSWRHFVEKEHNAKDLAEAMLDFQNKYDWDFIKKDKEAVHKALEAIALTIGDYAAKVIESGADGLFYAIIGFAREGYLTMDEWKEFVEPYDIMVLKNVNDHMVLLHTCGIFSNPQRFVDYPISSIHWAPSAPGNPQIDDCKKWIKDKTPMGGLDERLFGTGATETIYIKSRETLEKNKSIPFIFTPDCSLSIRTHDEELKVFRKTVEDFSF